MDFNRAARYDAIMRAALTIDDSTAVPIEGLHKRDRQSRKQVIKAAAEGLRFDQRSSEARKYRTEPHKPDTHLQREGHDPAGDSASRKLCPSTH